MRSITIYLLKPGKNATVTYIGKLLSEAPGYALVLSLWERPALDLGYTTFETGDHFYEHFFSERWFTIFELRSAAGRLKGWYCNIARPAEIGTNEITSEDLELDLFVSADRSQVLLLDEDEFEARNFAQHEPQTYRAALAALGELEQMARAGTPPFDRT